MRLKWLTRTVRKRRCEEFFESLLGSHPSRRRKRPYERRSNDASSDAFDGNFKTDDRSQRRVTPSGAISWLFHPLSKALS